MRSSGRPGTTRGTSPAALRSSMSRPPTRSRQRKRPCSADQRRATRVAVRPGGALLVGGGVAAGGLGDAGEGVFGGDEQGVEAGVLDGEAVLPRVLVAAVPVVGGEADVPAVVEVGGAFGRLAVVEVGAAVRAGGYGLDAGEGAVPGGAVVHAGLPGVEHGGESGAAQVAGAGEVVVPGGEARAQPGQEAAGAGGLRVGGVDEPGGEGVDGRLDDAGGLDGGGGSGRGARGRGAPEVGAREVGVEGDGRVEDDVRDAAVAPLSGGQGLQFALGAAG